MTDLDYVKGCVVFARRVNHLALLLRRMGDDSRAFEMRRLAQHYVRRAKTIKEVL